MPSRILIAEDDEVQGLLLRTAVVRRGYQVDMVSDGLEAVRRLRSGDYEFALLDYSLPELDGLAAARLTQDLLAEHRRPRLIAITASAEQLEQRDNQAGRSPSFDVIVSKASGFPAVLKSIEAALPLVPANDTPEAGGSGCFHPLLLKQLRASCLAALPGLVLALALVVALHAAVLSLTMTQAVNEAAEHTVAVSQDATGLVGAVHDAEMSQSNYLRDGTGAAREAFEADAAAVDRMLSEPSALNPATARDASGASPQQALTEKRLQALVAQAQARPVSQADSPAKGDPIAAGHAFNAALRQWADRAVSQAQGFVLAASGAVRAKLYLVVLVLACGLVCAVGMAARAAARQWRAKGSTVTLRPPAGALYPAEAAAVSGPRRGGGLPVISTVGRI